MTLQKYKSPCNIQSVRFLGPKIWAMVSQNIKNYNRLQVFKRLTNAWKPLYLLERAKSTLQILVSFDKIYIFSK